MRSKRQSETKHGGPVARTRGPVRGRARCRGRIQASALIAVGLVALAFAAILMFQVSQSEYLPWLVGVAAMVLFVLIGGATGPQAERTEESPQTRRIVSLAGYVLLAAVVLFALVTFLTQFFQAPHPPAPGI